jgi:N6-L-threonylcarbamoyladenine synthase
MATVLALETSCDETAAAVVRDRVVLSNVVASQIDIHRRFGGVVPEVASRAHVENMGAVTATALEQAGLDWGAIDGIAATCAPGLVGALMVGLTAGKTLAMVHHKPFLGVHHLEGHIYATYLSQPELQPPFLCLLVSGGHTSLIHVRGCGDYAVLGQTRDDAAGEAFDKVARLLGLGYPGGPIIDKLAAQGDATAFPLPEGNISLPEGGFHRYDSSFSGLKTAVLRLVQSLQKTRDGSVASGGFGGKLSGYGGAIAHQTYLELCLGLWPHHHCSRRWRCGQLGVAATPNDGGGRAWVDGAVSTIEILHRQRGHDCLCSGGPPGSWA